MIGITEFTKELVIFSTFKNNKEYIVIFQDYKDGKVTYPVGKGDSIMDIEFRGYKNMFVFEEYEDKKDQCVSVVYNRIVNHNYDSTLVPKSHLVALTDIDRFRALQQIKREGFGVARKI
jgi:hypothetical protein